MMAAAAGEGDGSVALWGEFARTRDAGLRAQLVQRYLGFARIMAGKLYANRPYAGLEYDDYLQFARVGLLESVDRYDAGRGALFETYAAIRIQGAILSGIQSYSELQEQVAARKAIVGERVQSVHGGAAPAGIEDTFAHLAEMAIGLAIGFALEGTGIYQSGDEAVAGKGYTGVEMKQLQARVLELVAALPERQRQVIRGHYLQQLRFEEVAEQMGISKGRVSQLHKTALQHLGDSLREAGNASWNY